MSKLYATISGDGRAKPKTRCANSIVEAAAQSWHGSITASIDTDFDGNYYATIQASRNSCLGGRIIWRGPLSQLIGAKSLKVED